MSDERLSALNGVAERWMDCWMAVITLRWAILQDVCRGRRKGGDGSTNTSCENCCEDRLVCPLNGGKKK